MMRHGAIVLCGGKSRRMGVDKAMLPFGPELMVQRVVRLVGEVCGPVAVVAAVGQQLPDLPDAAVIVRDRREGRGPLEGLLAGLVGIGDTADAVYATSCDVPLLVPAFARRMFELLEDFDVAVPKEERFHHPLAAVYRTRVLPHVEKLLADERMRPVFLFDEVRTREVPIDQLRDVDPELGTLQNLNRPEDYLDALKQAGFEVPPGVFGAG